MVWLLSDVAGRKSGKAGALGRDLVEVRGRDQLGFRCAGQLDEGAQQKLNLPIGDECSDVFQGHGRASSADVML